MGKRFVITIICFSFFTLGKSQPDDPTFGGHYTIVKDSKKIEFPKLASNDFCQKLYSIIIPDSIKFVDDGREEFYHISIEISFNEKGKVLSTTAESKGRAIYAMTNQIAEMLRNANWKAPNKKQKIRFQCVLYADGFRDPILKTVNNDQDEAICE